jgi:hypothetical protein
MRDFQWRSRTIFLIQYAERCFGRNDVIYGYFVDGEMRGAGELRGIDSPHSGQRQAEAAFSVENAFRCDGTGSDLVRHIIRAARNRRMRRCI